MGARFSPNPVAVLARLVAKHTTKKGAPAEICSTLTYLREQNLKPVNFFSAARFSPEPEEERKG